jgi:hypothetical protein
MDCFVASLLAMTEERAKLPTSVIPAQAGIQYAAAYRFNHRRLWNTGSSAFADDDSKKPSRGAVRPEFCKKTLPSESEGAGLFCRMRSRHFILARGADSDL